MSLLAVLVLAGLPFHVETREVDISTDAWPGLSAAPDVQASVPFCALFPEPGKPAFREFPAVNRANTPFRDVLVSWNADLVGPVGFVVELRVRPEGESRWSDWLHLGAWGTVPAEPREIACDGGKVDVDVFRGERLFDGAQVRVRAFSASPEDSAVPGDAIARPDHVTLRRITLCLSDLGRSVAARPSPSERPWGKVLDVPFRSQKLEPPEIAGRICSPTSLAMVLAYRGVDVTTLAVAERAYDAAHDIYGNWPNNVQAAYSFGVPGYLTRFSDWADVERAIAEDQPLIVSIAADEGQLTGAPYARTSGHLLVLCGFDARGDCVVNDPAAPDLASVRRTYRRAELERVWMARGGTAYVLERRP